MIFIFLFIGGMFFVSGLLNSGMDAIKYKTNQFRLQSDFWLSRGEFTPGKRTWLKKYIFVFLADGWHLLKFVMVLTLSLAIAITLVFAVSCGTTEMVLAFLMAYSGFSLGHILGYDRLWLK